MVSGGVVHPRVVQVSYYVVFVEYSALLHHSLNIVNDMFTVIIV